MSGSLAQKIFAASLEDVLLVFLILTVFALRRQLRGMACIYSAQWLLQQPRYVNNNNHLLLLWMCWAHFSKHLVVIFSFNTCQWNICYYSPNLTNTQMKTQKGNQTWEWFLHGQPGFPNISLLHCTGCFPGVTAFTFWNIKLRGV